jgi:hypothetical protein
LLFLVVLSLVTLSFAGTCNKGSQTRRRSVAEFDPNDFAVDWTGDSTISSLDGCADEDTFFVSVVVLDHLWIKFDPAPSAGPTCVKSYIFDSQLWADDTGAYYSVGVLQPLPDIWNATAAGTTAFSSPYLVGNITTLDLIDAIETFDGEFGGDYDIVTNNCAAKIIDVLTYINLNVNDAALLDWVATQLNTPKVADLLRNSTNVGVLYPGMSTVDILAKPNAELLSKLTYWSANETLAMYGESLTFYRALAAAPKAAPKAAPPRAAAPKAASAPTSVAKQPVSNSPQASSKASPATAVVVSVLSVSLAAVIATLF